MVRQLLMMVIIDTPSLPVPYLNISLCHIIKCKAGPLAAFGESTMHQSWTKSKSK